MRLRSGSASSPSRRRRKRSSSGRPTPAPQRPARPTSSLPRARLRRLTRPEASGTAESVGPLHLPEVRGVRRGALIGCGGSGPRPVAVARGSWTGSAKARGLATRRSSRRRCSTSRSARDVARRRDAGNPAESRGPADRAAANGNGSRLRPSVPRLGCLPNAAYGVRGWAPTNWLSTSGFASNCGTWQSWQACRRLSVSASFWPVALTKCESEIRGAFFTT